MARRTKRGFTLVELLIVIVVIGILSAMMMLSSTEAVASAKAAKIVNDLQTLRRAALAWYMDNTDKVLHAKTGAYVAGMVTINGKTKPVQEWTDADLNLSRYLGSLGGSQLNANKKSSSGNNQNTNIQPGNYGICDGGGKAGLRHVWYVGYCFKDGEDAVREKLQGKLTSAGLMFGTADAHPDPDGDNAAAIWMKILQL